MAVGNERRKIDKNENCERVIFVCIRGRGEIGRRAGFRFLWVTPCGFKSLRPHQIREHQGGVLFFGTEPNKRRGLWVGAVLREQNALPT